MKPVRERLMDATFEEVYQNGYQGASLANILARADVKKGSMYHYFSSKEEMVLAVIDERIKVRSTLLWEKLRQTNKAIIPTLLEILKNTQTRDFTRGCPIGNLLQDAPALQISIHEAITAHIKIWKEWFKEALDKAVALGEIRCENTLALSTFLIAAIEGAILLAKQGGEETEYLTCIDHLESYLNSLSS